MANTISATLLTEVLSQTALATLSSHLAPAAGYCTFVELDEATPGRVLQVPLCTAGATPSTGRTNFQSGDSTITNVSITPGEVGVSFQVGVDIQFGATLDWLVAKNLAGFAQAVADVLMTPITIANFGAAVWSGTAAGFGAEVLAALYAGLAGSPVKNLVLHSDYYARLIPAGLAPAGRLTVPGFDSTSAQSRWSAAGATVKGFVAAPSAVAVAVAPPAHVSSARSPLEVRRLVIPGLGLPCWMATWCQPDNRTQWASFDVTIGAAVADSGAMKLITS